MIVETIVPLVSGLGVMAGSWYWLKTHQHPELVKNTELRLVRELLNVQHEALLRELERVHARLDRLSVP